jgi:choice-of-anchor B domain-containing protein
MHRLKFVLSAAGFVCAMLASGVAAAHGDPESVLFVAADGVDRGDCRDPALPCRSISFVLDIVRKGDQIRVAGGSYEIASPEHIFYLVSGAVDIEGSYRVGEAFRQRDSKTSILTGVPAQYRPILSERGFHVVADRKAIDTEDAAEVTRLLAASEQLKSSMPATPCQGGMAAGLPCDSVDLLSHVALSDVSTSPSSAADVWGFVDLNTNREYALVGFSTGTAVFDVTDPERPLEVGFVTGQTTSWRDIKIYQIYDATSARWNAYAYVSADNASDGLVVIDLTGLPQQVSRVSFGSDFESAHNVYTTNTDYSTGVSLTGAVPTLIVAGPNRKLGQYRAYSLIDPVAPALINGTSATQYMHDASSILITDARKDTQCVNAVAYCQVLLDFNEDTVDIWDVTDPASPSMLSSTAYTNSGYVHSGWWSEDKQYMFVHDELDERSFGLQTTLRIFSLANLLSPSLAATWTGSTGAIDHNGFVRGNRYYMSNYTRGLTVLDITSSDAPSEVGFLDTFPGSSNSFNGAWGVYPFFFSKTIAISDINSGLYLARDRSLAVAEGTLSFAQTSFGGAEGQQLSLTVQRIGGSSNAVSVDYELVSLTADSNDYQVLTSQLNWASGDAAGKSVELILTNDGAGEGLEHLLVRLVNPAGGATLGDVHTAGIYVSDPGAASEIRFAQSAIRASETGFGTAVVVMQRTGSALGPVSVDYEISGGDAIPGSDFTGSASGTIYWSDGDADAKSLVFAIENDGIDESNESFELTLSNPSGATIGGDATAVVTITSATQKDPPAPPAPPAPARSSGGATGPAGLLLIGLLALLIRVSRRGRA